MIFDTKKYYKLSFALLFVIILFFIINIYLKKIEKDSIIENNPIVINLITSVHPNLSWNFKSIEKKILVKPGEVRTIDYIVENLDDKETTGIATFAYYPNQFGSYIRKLNCFCYDAQTLKPKQIDRYSMVILIDPEVTKDSKTKNTKEVTIQFTFFDYKEYKESEN